MSSIDPTRRFSFSIDRGGTYTDVFCQIEDETDPFNNPSECIILKLLSIDPSYPDAPREGIRRILEKHDLKSGNQYDKNLALCTNSIKSIRNGSTVATNALLERKGSKMVFVTNQGFKDLQHIGNQSRSDIFDLIVKKPELLYEEIVTISARVRVICEIKQHAATEEFQNNLYKGARIVKGKTGEKIIVIEELNENKIRNQLQIVFNKGINSISICLIHSYTFDEHEIIIGKIAKEIGFKHISLSSSLMPIIKYYPRSCTTIADAYLTPVLHEYLRTFISGFDDNLNKVELLFQQSDGGLTKIDTFSGFRAILSGPAGGLGAN